MAVTKQLGEWQTKSETSWEMRLEHQLTSFFKDMDKKYSSEASDAPVPVPVKGMPIHACIWRVPMSMLKHFCYLRIKFFHCAFTCLGRVKGMHEHTCTDTWIHKYIHTLTGAVGENCRITCVQEGLVCSARSASHVNTCAVRLVHVFARSTSDIINLSAHAHLGVRTNMRD